jgi:hypothetical protein
MCALVPNILVAPLAKTITTFRHLHPLAKIDLPPFVEDFHLEMDLILDKNTFIYALTRSPCLSFNSLSNTVYELLRDCFVLDDSNSGFEFCLKYVGILFVVMFLHQYHACLLHHI